MKTYTVEVQAKVVIVYTVLAESEEEAIQNMKDGDFEDELIIDQYDYYVIDVKEDII